MRPLKISFDVLCAFWIRFHLAGLMLASILRKRQPEINVSQAMDKMSISSHNLDIMFDIEDEFRKMLCGNAMIDSFGEQAKTDH